MRGAVPLALFGILIGMVAPAHGFASTYKGCLDPTVCNGQTGVTADQEHGEFHGLIMVPGYPGVLDTAAHAGTQPGCGDCVWSLIPACVFDRPGHPDNDRTCGAAGEAPRCDRDEYLFRLYLATAADPARLVATLCLGGATDVVPVGDIAAADVDRYLDDVVPPDLELRHEPPNDAVSNLPTYFAVRPPDNLAPEQFGGPQATETITITPAHYIWSWGDGSPAFATDDAGAGYPDGTVTHTYTRAERLRGSLTTRWSATYTITVAGQTFGPYDATGGSVTHAQPFLLTVLDARSHLVSNDGDN